MKRCVRCGASIDSKKRLWCDKCRKLVDEEVVDRAVSRPLAFYFSAYYRYWYPRKK